MFRLINSYPYKKLYFSNFFLNEYQHQLKPYLINAYKNTKTQLGKCSLIYTIKTLAFIDGTNSYIAGYYQFPLPHTRHLRPKRINQRK
ncbi:unnamed protein product [Rotaria sordida]|uniref:Uncharacterized protein n=1 Tax=Rotaria sordida TaxID=392033 RepID=A0A813PP26_9BILA|nr:unnamed protein product [Rotaria sordida]